MLKRYMHSIHRKINSTNVNEQRSILQSESIIDHNVIKVHEMPQRTNLKCILSSRNEGNLDLRTNHKFVIDKNKSNNLENC